MVNVSNHEKSGCLVSTSASFEPDSLFLSFAMQKLAIRTPRDDENTTLAFLLGGLVLLQGVVLIRDGNLSTASAPEVRIRDLGTARMDLENDWFKGARRTCHKTRIFFVFIVRVYQRY